MFGLIPYTVGPVLIDPDTRAMLEQIRGMSRGSQRDIITILKALLNVKSNSVISEPWIRSLVSRNNRPLASGFLACLLSAYYLEEIAGCGMGGARFTIGDRKALENLAEDVERITRW